MKLSRRTMLAVSLALPASAALAKAPKAKALRDMLVIDGLGGIGDPYSPEGEMVMAPRAIAETRASGLTAVNQTVGPVGNNPKVWEQVLESIVLYDKYTAANPSYLLPIRKADDFLAAKAQGKLGVMYCTQDTSMIGIELDRIAELKARGLRQIQLTYNQRNLSGDGALEPANAGLSRLGRATIARIEAERLVLDLSHGGAQTQIEAIAAATRPPIISHTGCRNLFDHPRNVWDTVMKAAADKGGVTGIYFMPFLAAGSQPTGEDLIAHIMHAARVCGEDHVSIGTDGSTIPMVIDDAARAAARKDWEMRSAAGFAAPGEGPDVFTVVMDYNSIDKYERLGADLQRRGWTSAQVEKLFGANLLRVYREVWG